VRRRHVSFCLAATVVAVSIAGEPRSVIVYAAAIAATYIAVGVRALRPAPISQPALRTARASATLAAMLILLVGPLPFRHHQIGVVDWVEVALYTLLGGLAIGELARPRPGRPSRPLPHEPLLHAARRVLALPPRLLVATGLIIAPIIPGVPIENHFPAVSGTVDALSLLAWIAVIPLIAAPLIRRTRLISRAARRAPSEQ
jgi:hypothetical protein